LHSLSPYVLAVTFCYHDQNISHFQMFIFSETSDKVSRVGGDFKETLRVSGGLDNIFDVMIDCHSALEVRSCLCFVYFVNVFYGKLSFGKSLHEQHSFIVILLQC
jgi:hypothetical protein